MKKILVSSVFSFLLQASLVLAFESNATFGTSVTAVCPAQTQVTYMVFDTTDLATDVFTAMVRIHNYTGAAKDYQVQLKRAGTDCTDAVTVVDNANSFASLHVSAGSAESAIAQWIQPSPGFQTDAYRLCVCTSSLSGTGAQMMDWIRISLDEKF